MTHLTSKQGPDRNKEDESEPNIYRQLKQQLYVLKKDTVCVLRHFLLLPGQIWLLRSLASQTE